MNGNNDKIYKPKLTEPQMKITVEVLENYLKSTEEVSTYPSKERGRWGDPATETARKLMDTQRKNAYDALDALKKELAKK